MHRLVSLTFGELPIGKTYCLDTDDNTRFTGYRKVGNGLAENMDQLMSTLRVDSGTPVVCVCMMDNS